MKVKKMQKFNYDKLLAEATSDNPKVRKSIFIEYYERFEEFPSYLFDNSEKIDSKLLETIKDLTEDPETPKGMQKGIALLMLRLPTV